ncbi:polymeric immunoglobulin receptor-like [Fundulus diaphanus]
MQSFQKPLFSLCLALFCVSSVAGLVCVFGYEGRDVAVSCSYPEGYQNYEKYLCRNDCDYSDILITTSQKNKTRYSVYDDKSTRIFTTTISNLVATDAGKYWCGVSRNGKDIYTEIKLETIKDSCCNTVNNIQGDEEGSVSISCPYDSESVDKLKYICRGNRPSTCLQQAVITSNNRENGRLRLTDDRTSRIFTITVSSLTLTDAGSYLCGMQKNTGTDVFSAVQLKVKEWCCVKSQKIKGIVGHSITFQCPYPPHLRDNRKFLCKGRQRSNCTDMMMGQSRFLLHSDSSESFSVTISQLEEGDSGTYWCRSSPQWIVGNYTQFHLSVGTKEQNEGRKTKFEELPAHGTTAVYDHQSNTVKAVRTSTPLVFKEHIEGLPDAALYSLIAVLSVLLLTLTIILVIVCNKKCHKVKEAEVISVGNKLDFKEACGGEDVYQNHDAVVMNSQHNTPKEQYARYHLDDQDEDGEGDYENVTAAEDIYCNQDFHKTQRK